jgi:DNA polymerase elongation subunit (family B)
MYLTPPLGDPNDAESDRHLPSYCQYENESAVDFKSMYPSIVMGANKSTETVYQTDYEVIYTLGANISYETVRLMDYEDICKIQTCLENLYSLG